MLGEVSVDGGLQLDDGSEHAALEASPGQGGEEPRGGGGREVKRPTRMPVQPCADFGMLVGSVVVGDGMDQLAGWHGGLNGAEAVQRDRHWARQGGTTMKRRLIML